MAICTECFELDKNFFATRCHHCNQHIGFFRQVFYQVTYVVLTLGLFFGILAWLF